MHRAAVVIILIACATMALLARTYWISRKVSAAISTPQQAVEALPCHQEIILIGDSRITQWPMHLFNGQAIANKGLSGETALQLKTRFVRDVIACGPKFVLIETGINDLVGASLAPPIQSQEIVRQLPDLLISLAEQAAQAGSAVSIATIIPPARPDLLRRMMWSETIRDYVQQTNARLRQHHWHSSVTLVDFAAVLDAADRGRLPEHFRRDTLHLNAEAYACLTATLPFAFLPANLSRADCVLIDPAG